MIIEQTWFQIGLKMIAMVMVITAVCQLNISHQTKAWLWRVTLMWLIALPFINPMLNWIELAWLQEPTTPLPTITNLSPITSVALEESNWHWYWLLIVPSLLGLARLVNALLQLHKLQRTTKPINPDWVQLNESMARQIGIKTPKLTVSDDITSPCTWGVFQPVIALPDTSFTTTQLKATLMHEMTHIRRGDWLWLFACQVLTRVFWFNPCLWWLRHQLLNSQEKACDEQVLQSQIQPSEYASTLLHFHAKNPRPMTAAMAQQSHLYQRLESILNPRRKTMKKTAQHLISGLTLATIVTLSATQVTIAHESDAHRHEFRVAPTDPLPATPPHPASHPEALVAPTPPTAQSWPEPPSVPEHLRAAEAVLAATSEVPHRRLHEQRREIKEQVKASRQQLAEQRKQLKQQQRIMREQQTAQQAQTKRMRADSIEAMRHMEKALAENHREMAELRAQVASLKAELDRVKSQQ